MLTKQPKYYFDLDGVRDPHSQASVERFKYGWNGNQDRDYHDGPQNHISNFMNDKAKKQAVLDKGKNPGDLWTFNTQPSPEKHYAMWPEKLVERMVLCSTKPGDTVCDPFAGSCTTGKVAIERQREFVGIDLGYEDIQKRRMSNLQPYLLP